MTLFLLSAAALGVIFLRGLLALPPLGHYAGPYGDLINAFAVGERHVTDTVSAVNFDYRGVDTVGEEFILFASVAGCALLLREQRDEQVDEAARAHTVEGRAAQTSSAVRLLCIAVAVPVSLFGWYIVSHGQLTPGGGFQGGVIMASAAVFLYLAGEYGALRRLNPTPLLEVADAIGAGGYVLLGFVGMAAGASFLENVLPLGPVGKVYSAGTIWAISMVVGLEVAAAFVLLLVEFLEQLLEIRQRRVR